MTMSRRTENPAVDARIEPSAEETMQASTTFPFPTKVRSIYDCQLDSPLEEALKCRREQGSIE